MGNSTTNATISADRKENDNQANSLTHLEWLSQIKEEKLAYQLKQRKEMKCDEMNDYQLFIQYLTFTTNITGYSEISIISRVVRSYVASVHGTSILKDNSFKFDGIRISMAIHPITAQIYIADECKIYKIDQNKNSEQQFQMIAKIGTIKHRITDLTFSCDGKMLLCLMNSNLRRFYRININKENPLILSDTTHKIDYLQCDFNHYYFGASYLEHLLKFSDFPNAHINITNLSTLYTLDTYRQQLWIICNSTDIVSNSNYNLKLLIMIPFKFVMITRQIQILSQQVVNLSHEAMNDIDNNKYEEELKVLQTKIDSLKLDRIKDENQCKFVNLTSLLELDLDSTTYVSSFDVDRLCGGIYIITSDKRLVRIERNREMIGGGGNHDLFDCINKEYPSHFICEQDSWKVTHDIQLFNVLPDGLPLGICNIRYDSITGRIIVADNYKIQSLYI